MLNPIEEAKFQELKDKCRDLRVPPPPDIFIGLQVHDHNGILVFDDVQRGHSWNRNYWGAMFYTGSGCISTTTNFGAGYMTAKSPAANLAGVNYGSMGVATGGLGVSSSGIQIGTGDTAFSVEQYAMAALIASGNGAGQMAYTAQSANVTAYTAGSKTWKTTLSRIFNNNSGGSITVKETGITCYGGIVQIFLERSVLSPTVTVATGGQLTVTYEISMDFSAID